MTENEGKRESVGEPNDHGAEFSLSSSTPPLEPVFPEQASKRAELILLWEELDAFLQLTPAARPPEPQSGPNTALEAARARFASLFDEEIQVVRAARNAAAHARPVDESVFEEALELARELVRIIHQGEGMFSSPPTSSASAPE